MYTIKMPEREETKDTFSEAWNYAKEKATDMAEEISEKEECFVGISFEKKNHSIILHNLCKDQFYTIKIEKNP